MPPQTGLIVGMDDHGPIPVNLRVTRRRRAPTSASRSRALTGTARRSTTRSAMDSWRWATCGTERYPGLQPAPLATATEPRAADC